ncbi:hypothetical protein HON36_00050 [Candidatus Parcubacteria bacterium]|jgi:hypothetical protein|nr:hypothetical protein [Candidatus Parcubacteria bacterium]MBT7227912.1 hypothetical protein [Candidatus Parcubacteria bacterium]
MLFKKEKNYEKIFDKTFKFFVGIFIFLIPWQARWIFYNWHIDGQLWEYGRLSIYASMIVLLLGALFFALSHKKELHFSKNKFFYVLFAYSVVVSLFSLVPVVSFWYLALLYMAALFAYMVKFIPKVVAFRMFLLSGLVQGGLALKQLFTQQIFANKWLGIAEHLPETLGTSVVSLGDQRILRAYGSLPHPNILGGFLFVAIFLGIYLWMNFYKKCAKDDWKKVLNKKHLVDFIFILTGIIVASFGLLATFSRGALLALVLSIFSLLLINIFKRDWLVVNVVTKFGFLFLIIFLVFNSWWPGTWSSRVQADNRLEQQSVEQRVDTLDQLHWDSYKNIFFGQGLGMNTYVTYQKNNPDNVFDSQPIHDIFILMLAEVGMVGVLLLVNVVRLIIKEANQVDIMSTSLILGLIVLGLFDHYLWTSWTGWLLMTLAFVNLYKHRG